MRVCVCPHGYLLTSMPFIWKAVITFVVTFLKNKIRIFVWVYFGVLYYFIVLDVSDAFLIAKVACLKIQKVYYFFINF